MKRLTWLLLGAALAACSKSEENGGAAAAAAPAGGPPPGMPVEAAVIKAAPLAHEVIAVGSLRSAESVTLRSEITGRIAEIGFKEGQPVEKGQLLFALDDSVYRAESDQARASHTLAKRNADRAAELFGKNLVSQADRDTAAANLDVSAANLALAEARLAKTRISAPFAGVAGLRMVSPGDLVREGQDLVNLEDLSTIKLDFRLAEAALQAISVGQKLDVLVDAYPGQRFSGEVYAIDPRLATDTRSIAVRARLSNKDGRLRPGLFARVNLQVASKAQALVVPEQAIFPRGDELFVYAIEDGKAVMRAVTLGQRLGGKAEVVTGLKDGDTVITAGYQKIGPGAPVMPINLGPPPGAAPAPAGDKTPG